MPRPEGYKKTGGREKGTPNRKSLEIQEVLFNLGVDVVGQLVELLPELDADKRASVLLDLMHYIYPKRKAVEICERDFQARTQVVIRLPANGREPQ